MQIPSIKDGSDFFQIRVWNEVSNGNSVFILKYADSVWSAEGYTYHGGDIKSNADTIPIVIDTIALDKPVSGWNAFLNRLIDKGILEIEDESTIPGYPEATDLHVTSVEIAANRYWKYSALSAIQGSARRFPEAKKFLEIIQYIKDEFPTMPILPDPLIR
jgi:hypothetical protein